MEMLVKEQRKREQRECELERLGESQSQNPCRVGGPRDRNGGVT